MNNLWIDDIRTPPFGWKWAKTSAQAIAMINSSEPFYQISFDHDLGGDDTARKVILWLCENEGKWPQRASVHSMNPIGREWLLGMIDRYGENCKVMK